MVRFVVPRNKLTNMGQLFPINVVVVIFLVHWGGGGHNFIFDFILLQNEAGVNAYMRILKRSVHGLRSSGYH